jgi:enoyl-CoA hydratase
MDHTTVTTEVRPDGIGILTLARPDRLNAISSEMADAIGDAVAGFAGDTGVRAIVVAGAGKAFCAGADIAEFGQFDRPAEFGTFIARLAASLDVLGSCPKPSVAAVQGVALGGGLELALACDIRISEEATRLGVPEIKLGLLPGATGTARLPRLVPAPVARRMLLTGEPIGAEEALRFGLIAAVVPPGQALEAAVSEAARLAALPPLALAAAKRLLAAGSTVSLDTAIELERQTVSLLFATDDRAEGVSAFLEKRAPSFQGR